jgi:DsbC/DsbD-like thiol-disulfide interchange protein
LLIPTTIKIDDDKNITTGRQEFPPAKKFKLEGTDDFLDVYDGVFEIRIPFKTIGKIPKGKYILNAKLHYQACDNKICLFPKSIEFSIPIKVI